MTMDGTGIRQPIRTNNSRFSPFIAVVLIYLLLITSNTTNGFFTCKIYDNYKSTFIQKQQRYFHNQNIIITHDKLRNLNENLIKVGSSDDSNISLENESNRESNEEKKETNENTKKTKRKYTRRKKDTDDSMGTIKSTAKSSKTSRKSSKSSKTNGENKLNAELVQKIAKQIQEKHQEQEEIEKQRIAEENLIKQLLEQDNKYYYSSIEQRQKRQQEEELRYRKKQQKDDSSGTNEKKLKSVTELMQTINMKLKQKQQQQSSFVDDPFLYNSEDRSSISSQMMDNASYNKLLEFNAKNDDFDDFYKIDTMKRSENMVDESLSSLSTLVYHVIVIFGKPLIQDQITLEYAYRIRTLVQLLKDSHYYDNDNTTTTNLTPINNSFLRPNLITFISSSKSSNNGIINDGTAGYIFFRQLASIYNLTLDDNTINFHIQNSSVLVPHQSKELNEVSYIKQLIHTVKSNYLPSWLQSKQSKARVHFTFISSKYHLCNLNDIHQRSPRYGLFSPILDLERLYNKPNLNYKYYKSDLDQVVDDNLGMSISMDVSWTYSYSSYPYASSTSTNIIVNEDNEDDLELEHDTTTTIIDFLSKCYILGQELTPILVNMRGVVDKTEFFQRDNFLVLSTIRRLLVKHIEEIYKIQKLSEKLNYDDDYTFLDSLNAYASHTLAMKHNNRNDIIIVDVMECLESALLLLGRCTDMVRPAGLLVSIMDENSWIKALKDLEQCMNLIYSTCDPDRPLAKKDWVDLLSLDDGFNGDSVSDDDEEEGGVVNLFEPDIFRQDDAFEFDADDHDILFNHDSDDMDDDDLDVIDDEEEDDDDD